MPKKQFTTPELHRHVDPLVARSHGAKMSEKSKALSTKKVEDLGHELDFYHEFRNEPVPPDPSVTSAVKYLPGVKPPSGTVAKYIDLGKPLKKPNQSELNSSWWTTAGKKSESPNDNVATIPLHTGINGVVTEKLDCMVAASVNKSEGPRALQEKQTCLKQSSSPSQSGRADPKINSLPVLVPYVKPSPSLSAPLSSASATSTAQSNGISQVNSFSQLSTPSPSTSIVPAEQVNGISLCPLENALPDTTPEDYDDSSRGPGLFVQVCTSQQPLINVVIDSAFNAQNFIIRVADLEMWQELSELEAEMFEWFNNHSVSILKIKTHHFYGVMNPEKKECLRVQLLSKFMNGTVMVYLLDRGTVEQVLITNLVPLKSEWKELYQLCCHARYKGDDDLTTPGFAPEIEQVEDAAFQAKFVGKLITVEPTEARSIRAKFENSSGEIFTCKVKLCTIKFFNEKSVLDYLEGCQYAGSVDLLDDQKYEDEMMEESASEPEPSLLNSSECRNDKQDEPVSDCVNNDVVQEEICEEHDSEDDWW